MNKSKNMKIKNNKIFSWLKTLRTSNFNNLDVKIFAFNNP